MDAIGVLHENLVFRRRTRVLAEELAKAIPDDGRTVLDVGCGDGTIDVLVKQLRPNLVAFPCGSLMASTCHFQISRLTWSCS